MERVERVPIPIGADESILLPGPDGGLRKLSPLAMLIGPHGTNLRWISRVSRCKVSVGGRGTALAAAHPEDPASLMSPHFQIADLGQRGGPVAARACSRLLEEVMSFYAVARRAEGNLAEIRRLRKFVAWFSTASAMEREEKREQIVSELRRGRGLAGLTICQGAWDPSGAKVLPKEPNDRVGRAPGERVSPAGEGRNDAWRDALPGRWPGGEERNSEQREPATKRAG